MNADNLLPRIFIQVVGFTDVERHAINTLCRLSEGRPAHAPAYHVWAQGAPAGARLALMDGTSPLAHAALALLANAQDTSVIWVGGALTPANAWRVFARPIRWPAVLQAMDDLFCPKATLDLDVISGESAAWAQELELHAPKRALVLDADLEARLYMRAKLGSVGIHLVDEALDARQASALLTKPGGYQWVCLDAASAGGDTWAVVKAATAMQAQVLLTTLGSNPVLRAQAWFADCTACLQKPLEPDALNEVLRKI